MIRKKAIYTFAKLVACLCMLVLPVLAGAQFDTSDEYVQLGYEGVAHDNPVAKLQERLLSGEVVLDYNDRRGYFDAVLKALDIKPASQMLVFSPTSLQHKLISPQTPRGVYFNDNTYLGFVQHSTIVEVAAIDEKMGVVFYTFDNAKGTKRFFERANQTCLVCHDTQGTMGGGVPMLMALSSVYSDRNVPLQNFSGIGNVGDQTPVEDRWGGWYVTGRHGLQAHLGNILLKDPIELSSLDDYRMWNVESLSGAGFLDTSPYVSETSDIVALMLLEHQVTVQNQITYIRFKAPAVLERRGMHDAIDSRSWADLPVAAQQTLTRMLDKLVSVMVMMNAADISSRMTGSQDFVDGFMARGPKDPAGRSLRDLDLEKRLFRYPLTYLIYTDDFASLPGYAREYVYREVAAWLGGEDILEGHTQYSLADRREALDILKTTHAEFAAFTAQHGTLADRN